VSILKRENCYGLGGSVILINAQVKIRIINDHPAENRRKDKTAVNSLLVI
jgi:hypothetical protein